MQTVNFDNLNVSAGDLVLDIGCGEGRHSIGLYVNREINAVGMDLSLEDMQTARSRIKDFSISDTNESSCFFGAGSIQHLPFKDNLYDAVICSEVLEHLESLDSAVSEIVRVLKPGGVLAVSVPRYLPELICWKLSPG
ncbi:MAG TPA: class I SAM-dependent methyltransferase, partial [Gammaproteobacteria bacterium]|nr:class I SAM-dependent methyltransferase [Gammaproteobacteria bacterium]